MPPLLCLQEGRDSDEDPKNIHHSPRPCVLPSLHCCRNARSGQAFAARRSGLCGLMRTGDRRRSSTLRINPFSLCSLSHGTLRPSETSVIGNKRGSSA
eukprot:CAMPEP_0113728348 /NCGR_PEP_ID=MMETSP0038_2-20120614/41827_1 /TAXON_ID=2898 /ORGANISM="Cryptomonas paramecium" /LENGTH=97 /DNA_ID=CAMNT_0000659835 /DNA_START=120 /DNA_END=410 /DNA_ORIENTATION=+ /assembly_acc=CAM_ASM_000170